MKVKSRDIDNKIDKGGNISKRLDVKKAKRTEQELKKLQELSSLIGNDKTFGLSLKDLRKMRPAR